MNCSQQATYYGNEERVSKPTHIVIHYCICKEQLKAVKRVFAREKSVKAIHITAFREAADYEPEARKYEYKRNYYQY